MFSALDLYLASLPLPALLAYTVLAFLAVGLGPFAVATVVEHVAAQPEVL
jgi:hypothetical protein